MIVEVGDFELTAPRGPQGRDDIGRLLVVEVKAGDRVTRGRLRRLLNDGAYAAGQVKVDDAILIGISHLVGEDNGPLVTLRRLQQRCAKSLTIKNVIT